MAMLFVYVIENMIVPLAVFSSLIVLGYFVQLIYKVQFLPSVIPVFISGELQLTGNVLIAYIMTYSLGIASLIALLMAVKYRDLLK